MLTPQQIEAAARELCARRGVDPEFLVEAPLMDKAMAAAMARPVWKMVADEIRAHAELQDVIEFVQQGAAP